ncbi:MAG: preprotein translocase subunit SecG [bacterium]|nr:preprotein translocase subunit SecG [bacterium]
MKTALLLAQIVIGIVVSTLILLQAKGTGLGRTFGSTAYHSRRGLETLMFRITIILAVAFVAISILGQLVL